MNRDDFISGAQGIGQEVKRFSPEIASVRFSTATYGKAVAVGWGQPRFSANTIWAGSVSMRAPGPGGIVVVSSNSIQGVCEGPIAAYRRVWNGKDFYQTTAALPGLPQTGFPSAGITLFLGDYAQLPVPFISSSLPLQALAYRGIAYVFTGLLTTSGPFNSQFGSALPSASFEVATAFQVGSIGSLAKTVTADASSNTLSSTAHGFEEFQNLRFTSTGTLPGGIAAGTDYMARNVGPNSFQLVLNAWDFGSDGTTAAVVDIASAGTGTITATPFVLDANPKDCIVDALTNPKYGIGFPSAMIGDLTAFSNYCIASGSFISPAQESQEAANSFLERLMIAGFAGVFFSEGLLKIVPYCDTAISGFGATFTPNTSALYALTDDDFAAGESGDPIAVKRIPQSDVYNAVKVQFENRLNQYLMEVVEIRDEASIQQFGYRPKDTIVLHEIKDPAVAKWVATLILFREQNVRNTYVFRLADKYLLVEPMDLLTLTESTGTPLDNVPVRVTEIVEETDGYLTLTAEDFPVGSAIGISYPNQVVSAFSAGFNAPPGNANSPVAFIAPLILANGNLELWLAISGGVKFGGCDVWYSFDDSSGPYQLAGRMNGKAATGVLTSSLPIVADPDFTTTLGVDLFESAGSLSSVNAQQAAAGVSLCYAGGELFAYTTATSTGLNLYNLTGLRRGLFGSPISAVASGSRFARIDDTVFRFPLVPQSADRTLYLKFLSFNTFGAAQLDISSVTAFAVPIGKTAPPPDVTSFTIEGTVLSWTAVTAPGLIGYVLRYQPGTSRSWGDAIPLHSGVVPFSPFDMLVVPIGPVTIMIKVVDSAGNESTNPAFIVTDLGDPLVANVVETFDRKAAGFPGVKTNCSVVGGNLVADAAATPAMWDANDQVAMWDADPSTPMWSVTQYMQMTYVDTITFTQALAGSQLTIQSAIQGDPWSLEYRENSQAPMWADDPETPMWAADPSTPMWDSPPWLPWPGQITVRNSIYDFRIIAGQADTQGMVSELTMTVDAPDIIEDLLNVAIASGGTRLAPTKPFTVFKGVHLTLLDDGGNATTARQVDLDPILKPLVECLNVATPTTGHVNARIQGY
jgi:hypothetical protein